MDESFELTGIKMTPYPFFPFIINRTYFTTRETLDMSRFDALGVIKNLPDFDQEKMAIFEKTIADLRSKGLWTRSDLIDLFNYMIPEFSHKETGKFLDGRM